MVILSAYCRGVTAFHRYLMMAMSALMFLIVPVMCYEVVMRYFYNAPTVWALELSALLFGPYFMLAGPYLLHTNGHVSVDILYSNLPPRMAAVLDCLTYPVIFFFALVLAWVSFPVAMNSYTMGETSFTPWNPVIWPFKFIIPVAMVLLFLQALAEFIRALCRVFGCKDPMA